MTNIKIVKDVYSKYIFSINLILLNCIDVFNVNSIFFHYVPDIKTVKDVYSIDTYNINLIL